jgi:formate hydrogenlyase transcriptional activator
MNVHRRPKELFRALAGELRQVVHFDALALFLYNESENKVENAVLEALRGRGIAVPVDFPAEETITWWVYHQQKPVVIASRQEESRFPKVMQLFEEYEIESCCVLPLTTAYRRLGSLCFASQSKKDYTQDEIRYLQLVTDQVALAVDNALREAQRSREALFLAEGQKLGHTGNWTRDVSTGEVLLSQESLRMFGFGADTGKLPLATILSRVHPEDRGALEKTVQEGLRSVADFETEFRVIREDGAVRNIHVVGHPVRNEAGELVEFVGTHMDVTEQQRSRKELEEALAEIRALKDQLYQENVALRQEVDEMAMFEDIVGKSEALQKVLKDVQTVAPTNSTVLIYGETGSGKELIARAIHNLSARSGNAFVKVNCAAIPTGLLESELFGHERGAFTGAIAQRIGRFELAQRGTVFLDEIGEIPLELQPKLLRVLQEREFERLGSSRTLRTDARLIAATNQDLSAMVKEQKFRSDLFYRLNVFPIHVPALRERPEDLPLLVRHFAELFSRRMGKSIERIPTETMDALMRYRWPGNVRELQNVIERAVILSKQGILRVSVTDLQPAGVASTGNGESAIVPRKRSRTTNPPPDREQVVQALKQASGRVGGNDGAAARLGMKRTTLIALLKRLGIDSRSVIERA